MHLREGFLTSILPLPSSLASTHVSSLSLLMLTYLLGSISRPMTSGVSITTWTTNAKDQFSPVRHSESHKTRRLHYKCLQVHSLQVYGKIQYKAHFVALYLCTCRRHGARYSVANHDSEGYGSLKDGHPSSLNVVSSKRNECR